jgi:MazG family protein
MTVDPAASLDVADPVARLLAIMARLRRPGDGCPWDLEQTFETIVPHTIEEAYEVAEAVESGNRDSLRDELGDLLLQVVYHSRMAQEEGAFDFQAVAAAVSDKLIRRHPHVFGDASVATAAEQTVAWEAQKARERAAKAETEAPTDRAPSALAGVSTALPAMTRALKLQNRAARVGFDWSEASDVVAKIEEELQEVKDEFLPETPDPGRLRDEVGDLLFSVVNLARKAGIDPETALRGTNRKFENRFRRIEELLYDEGRNPTDASLEEMDALWVRAKREHLGRDA